MPETQQKFARRSDVWIVRVGVSTGTQPAALNRCKPDMYASQQQLPAVQYLHDAHGAGWRAAEPVELPMGTAARKTHKVHLHTGHALRGHHSAQLLLCHQVCTGQHALLLWCIGAKFACDGAATVAAAAVAAAVLLLLTRTSCTHRRLSALHQLSAAALCRTPCLCCHRLDTSHQPAG